MQKLCLFVLFAIFAISAFAQKPDFTAPNMDGKLVNLSDLRGKVVVLNLWFINCPNCLLEIKELNQLVAEYKDNKEIVFIAPAASKKADLEKFLKKNPFSYQVLPNANLLILTKFGVADKRGNIEVPFPMHYVLDREGNVVVKVEGTKGIASVRSELKNQFATKTATLNPSK